jgi:hypothetical protein
VQTSRTDSSGAGYYELVSVAGGDCADIWGGRDTDGIGIGTWNCTGAANQQWLVHDATATAGSTASLQSGNATAGAAASAKVSTDAATGADGADSFTFSTNLSGTRGLYAPSTTAGLVTESQAGTSFMVKFASAADRQLGYFQLVHPSGLCLNDPGDTSQLTLATCVNQDGTAAANRQQWFLTRANGGYMLRSRYDGHCVDVSGASASDGANVISWACKWDGSANQIWTPKQGTSWATTADAGSMASMLASAQTAGSVAAAQSSNAVSHINFCNHGSYVAEGVIALYKFYNGQALAKEGGPWSTPTIAAGSCSQFTIPAGQGVVAEVSMHEFTDYYMAHYGWDVAPGTDGTWTQNDVDGYWTSGHDNDKTVADFDLAAPYTNVEFDFYGTVCYPSYGISHQDTASALATQLTARAWEGGCASDSTAGTVTMELADDLDDLGDGLTEVVDMLYVLMAGL